MKKTKENLTLLLVFSMALLIWSCNNSKVPKMTTVPFKVEALGDYKYVGPDTLLDAKCTGELSAWRALVDGKGQGEPMGKITVHFDFCGDTLGNYGNLDAYILTEEGDSIFINGSGQVINGRLDSHPDHVISYWNDEFNIIGGSGKYKSASGTVATKDYNSSLDINSHHNWEGTITMLEKK